MLLVLSVLPGELREPAWHSLARVWTGPLAPGQLPSVYPPFCTKEAADGVSLSAVAAEDRLAFLADFARALR